MKKTATKLMAMLLAVILCVSQIIPVSAATVSYVTGSADGFTGVIRNWGTRGETADFLSPNALDFYEDNDTSYSELSGLSGSATQSLVPSSALYKELQTLMKSNHTKLTSYGNIRYLFAFTDCENSSTTKLSEFYLGTTIDSQWDGGVTFNREHCWPKSKTSTPTVNNNTTGEAADIMSQRPADPSTNSGRSNDAYGIGSSYFDPNCKQQYGDNIRGDVARVVLYVYVRWGNTSNMWGSTGVMQNKDVLLDWMEEDPVDTWEMGRNDSVESITGTRNVFVDYPELAFRLFNQDVPSGYETPSGGVSEDSSYTVKASTNNSDWGTVAVSGNTIIAYPATGYEVSSYTILAGTASVTRDGNYFTVVPTSDVSVRINFAATKEYTLTFMQSGAVVATQTQKGQSSTIMPSHSGTVPEEYTFAGWTIAPVTDTLVRPQAVYAPGDSYTVTANETFYALYAKWEEGVAEDVFSLHTGAITEGEYLLTEKGGALKASINSGTRFDYTDITVNADTVSAADGAIIWRIEQQADGYYTIYNTASGKYAAGNGTKNKGALTESLTEYAKWTVTGTETYEFKNLGNSNKGVNDLLRRNGTYGFACYSSSTGSPLTLYKRSTGSAVYTTEPVIPVPTYTVRFLNEDGSVISEQTYAQGETVVIPQAPTKAEDESYTYEFAGWSPSISETVTGSAEYTATFTPIEKPTEPPVMENAIVKQPEDITVDSGETVKFTVAAQGEIASYKWEYRKLYKWFDTSMTGFDTDTLTVPATGARNGYDYRCTVTFADGTVMVSEPAELTVKTYMNITYHPKDQVAVLGYKGQFTAAAEGEGIKYQWQYCRPGSEKWIDTAMEGATKATVMIETTTARDGYRYRCRITDVTGNEQFTEVATMRVLSFKSHPAETFALTGDKVQFSVTTSVESGFTYQWQYRRSATANWTNTSMTGYNTATLTVDATKARNGYAYRCVLTGAKNSQLESKEAVLYVSEPVVINAQPKNTKVAVGQVASFTVSADNVYTYQWQYQTATGTRWSNTGATGNKTQTLSITATTGNSGYKYRCMLTGMDGAVYYTDIATLTVG